MAKQSAGEKRQGEESAVKEVISWVVTIVLAVAAALVIKNYVIINANIPSGSMENTIMTDDRLFGNRLAYNKNRTPQRGDIIIFKFPDDESENFIKRVIGLPGETVVIEDAKIYIDGSPDPLDEDYLKEEWVIATGPYTFEVPEDSYLEDMECCKGIVKASFLAGVFVGMKSEMEKLKDGNVEQE